MARRMPPIEETLSAELWNEFLEFIAKKGGIPIERTFWGWLIGQGKYTSEQLPEHIFRYAFSRLYDEGYIRVDRETRCLIPLRDCKVLVNR